MKIALLGSGKTGGKVQEILNLAPSAIFNRSNIPTKDKLQTFDIIISFLPGDAFLSYIPMLLDSNIPLVTGSTGFKFSPEVELTLKEKNTTWIHATNFSISMNIVKLMIKDLSKLSILRPSAKYSILETHHVHKKDAPSGTALTWKEWLNHDVLINSLREGDVIGTHSLMAQTESESIELTHKALDRKIFAEGAIFAAEMLSNHKLMPGLIHFSQLIEMKLKGEV